MAARTVKIRHDDETRAKIKTTQLLNRLNNHIFKDVEVSVTQLKAIEILLRKTLPDLSGVQHSGHVMISHEDALDDLDDGPGTQDPTSAA